MLPLDFHAHVQPTIAIGDLDRLEACVVAVTRTPAEYASASKHNHAGTIWGVGTHPSVLEAHTGFDKQGFRQFIQRTPVIGEIGLDGRSRVPLGVQVETLNEILEMASEQPRLITMHSSSAIEPVLSAIEAWRPKIVVLHWWRGNDSQTLRALSLDCYFSMNFAQTRKASLLDIVPKNRILTETDHPFGDRQQPGARRPGLVDAVERCLAEYWGITIDAARQQVWRNLLAVVNETGTIEMLPATFKQNLLAV